MLLRCTSQCVSAITDYFSLRGSNICHTIWRAMAYLGIIQYGERWGALLFFRSSLPSALRLADPSVRPCNPQLRQNGYTMSNHRWEKRGGPCQCWKHHHITVGLVEYSQHFKTRLLYSQKRKEKWGKLWWKVRLWRCWFAAEWTEAFRSCREAQVGATWLFICNVTFKQRAPCHRDYSIFLWIMPKHCAHVKTHTYTQARSASGWQKL